MGVTIRFPAMLRSKAGAEIVIAESVRDVADALLALERHLPGISQELADPIFNIAVNDEMLLHGVRQHPLNDGDIIEIIPTISGG